MRILVGCPVYERAWILPKWFESVQVLRAYGDLSFVFAYTPSEDNTLELLTNAPGPVSILYHTDGVHSIERNWGTPRIRTMADMRNRLLDFAAETQPDIYFSLDSDVLLPQSLSLRGIFGKLHKVGEGGDVPFMGGVWDAFAPLVYLGPGDVTNAFTGIPGRPLHRVRDTSLVRQVTVICAAKLMRPAIFSDPRVRYDLDGRGEDFAWSLAAIKSGYKLGWMPEVKCKHIMERTQLDRFDKRIGW